MPFYFREPKTFLTTCYKVLKESDFQIVKNSLFKSFTPRFFQNRDFTILTDLEYAKRIAEEKNNWTPNDGKNFYIVRFLLPTSFIQPYLKEPRYACLHKEALEELNNHLIGYIEVIEMIEVLSMQEKVVPPIKKAEDKVALLIKKTNDMTSLYKNEYFGFWNPGSNYLN